MDVCDYKVAGCSPDLDVCLLCLPFLLLFFLVTIGHIS